MCYHRGLNPGFDNVPGVFFLTSSHQKMQFEILYNISNIWLDPHLLRVHHKQKTGKKWKKLFFSHFPRNFKIFKYDMLNRHKKCYHLSIRKKKSVTYDFYRGHSNHGIPWFLIWRTIPYHTMVYHGIPWYTMYHFNPCVIPVISSIKHIPCDNIVLRNGIIKYSTLRLRELI